MKPDHTLARFPDIEFDVDATVVAGCLGIHRQLDRLTDRHDVAPQAQRIGQRGSVRALSGRRMMPELDSSQRPRPEG